MSLSSSSLLLFDVDVAIPFELNDAPVLFLLEHLQNAAINAMTRAAQNKRKSPENCAWKCVLLGDVNLSGFGVGETYGKGQIDSWTDVHVSRSEAHVREPQHANSWSGQSKQIPLKSAGRLAQS